MNKLITTVLTLLFFCNINLVFGHFDSEIHIDKDKLKKAPKTQLKLEQQGKLNLKPFKVDVGFGEVNSFLLTLPKFRNETVEFELKSIEHRKKYYYPIIIKLDKEFEIINIQKDTIELEGDEVYGISQTSKVSIDTNTSYILITTEKKILSKRITYSYSSQNLMPVSTGSSIIYVPSGQSYMNKKIYFSDDPKFYFQIPNKNGRKLFRKEQGIFFGFGAFLGGEKLGKTQIGGGATMVLGAALHITGTSLVGRGEIGIRYQGSKDDKAENIGFFTAGVLTYQTKYVNLGFGGQYDFGSSITNTNGKKYNFVPQLGPKFLIEARLDGRLHLGVEYILMKEVKDKENRIYNGNRFSLMLRMFIGK
ncbi:MAG: hypothetical protein N4A45_03085 [Flavobacteriales bacterium]|jgi:hypothetical protein|nr:hypothetical protein [Flavobacteriales bacterium]